MSLWHAVKRALGLRREPEHLRRGRVGEAAARRHLKRAGLKFLTANFRTKSSEIDLVFRDGDCLVFVEVKARTEGGWTRPAAAVDQRKRGLLGQAAKEYLRRLRQPGDQVSFRHHRGVVARRRGERGAASAKRLPADSAQAAPLKK